MCPPQLKVCGIKKSLFYFKFEFENKFKNTYKLENKYMKDKHIYYKKLGPGGGKTAPTAFYLRRDQFDPAEKPPEP